MVRKTIAGGEGPDAAVRRDPLLLLPDQRPRRPPPGSLVFKANDRCNQENLIAQLKGGVRALRAAVDNLVSNWAYMVMTGLAWNLKAWLALSVPEHPRHRELHREQKRRLLTMEFRRFVNTIIQMPCQIIRGGRAWCTGCCRGTSGRGCFCGRFMCCGVERGDP